MSNLHERYEQVYQSLSRVELQRGMRGLEELDVGKLFDYDTDLWLGFYTVEGLELALERYGLFDDIRQRGFEELRLEIQTDDPEEHMLRIWSVEPDYDEPLVELVVARDILRMKGDLLERVTAEYTPVLTVQWLLMQHPGQDFDQQRLPLPGQRLPGLGVGEQVMELLTNVCRRLNLGGLITVPSHFHNAAMYGVTYSYVCPKYQGLLAALERDLLPAVDDSLARASWAVYWKMIVDRLAAPQAAFEWFHEAMLLPVSEPFTRYFTSQAYRDEVARECARHRFDVFAEALERNLRSRGLEPWDRKRVLQWLDAVL